MEKRLFSELGLSPEILKAVDKMGFEEASPIQTAVIPAILAGGDVIGQSSTGSGKTAAFAIPAIELVDPALRKPQVLILCPTRELAVQVSEEIGKLSWFKKGIHSVPIYGGQSYDRQFRALDSGVQVVIGTPGRVMDHMERGTLRLDALKLVVLDEADRMLDMGFRDDIEHILDAVPEKRQLLFFSATMPTGIRALINRFANEPKWIKIESHAQNAPKVDQVYFEVERRSKLEVLCRVIDLHDFRFGIIFCSTKIMVDELQDHLHARGYSSDRLHGDISQALRTKVMEKFRRRGFEFLVATDVAARGLDVDDLEVVFNFDLPNDAEDYTHRIGRTGRAGRSGKAYTFVSGREIYKLQSMVHYAKLKIRRETVPSLDQVEEARVSVFFEKLRATLEAGKYTRHERMIDRLLEQGYPSTDICSALIHLLRGGEAGKPDAGDDNGEGAPAPSKPSFAKPAKPAKAAKPVEHSEPTERSESPAPRMKPASAVVPVAPSVAPRNADDNDADDDQPRGRGKQKYDRQPRTGREAGYTTIYINVGRKQLVTPGDLVGKIAGVTRLPANVVGAIDIHQRHSLIDVSTDAVELVMHKLAGVRIKGEALAPTLAKTGDNESEG